MANNKVQLADGTTLMDISDSTVTEDAMLEGAIAYNAAGEQIVGIMSNPTTLINRTTAVNAADTNYTALMARGEKLLPKADFDAVTDWSTHLVNGAIAWGYE